VCGQNGHVASVVEGKKICPEKLSDTLKNAG
jgi:hypothetical protein